MMTDFRTPSDRSLVTFLILGPHTQQGLDVFLSRWDLETEGAERGLLLAVFKRAHPHLAFPAYCGPRLDGLIRYYRYQNAAILDSVHYSLQALDTMKVPMAALDGWAMRLLFPECPRPLYRIEIGVPFGTYPKVRRFSHGNLRIRPVLDHYFEGETREVSGLRIHVPAAGILTCAALVRLALIMDHAESACRLPVALNDIWTLMSLFPSASLVQQCAEEGKVEAQVKAAVLYFDQIVPGTHLKDSVHPLCSESQWRKYQIKKRLSYFRMLGFVERLAGKLGKWTLHIRFYNYGDNLTENT